MDDHFEGQVEVETDTSGNSKTLKKSFKFCTKCRRPTLGHKQYPGERCPYPDVVNEDTARKIVKNLLAHEKVKSWISDAQNGKQSEDLNAKKCDICETSFANDDTLNKHKINVHQFLKCSHCPDIFKNNGILQEHIQQHQSSTCQHCYERFETENLMNKHVADIHMTFECNKCPEKFITNHLLAKHNRSAHPIKTHACTV